MGPEGQMTQGQSIGHMDGRIGLKVSVTPLWTVDDPRINKLNPGTVRADHTLS